MSKHAHMAIHFTDGSSLVLSYERDTASDMLTQIMNTQKALGESRIVAEVDGNLIVIPETNIKYVHITPAPDPLPQDVLRGVKIVKDML